MRSVVELRFKSRSSSADSSWPRWVLFAVPSLAAMGYAVAEMMPWSMLGDVIDEDELATGERREGMYVGFLHLPPEDRRRDGGARDGTFVLELSGFVGGLERTEQTETGVCCRSGR